MYRVLLVDDDPIALSGIKCLIDWGKNGCVIEDTALDGITALKKIEQLRPDLVISDIVMPGLSGLELLKHFDSEFSETVFIMLTNHEDFSFARESLNYRAAAYLVKADLGASMLEETITRAIEELKNRNILHGLVRDDNAVQAKSRQSQIQEALTSFLYNWDGWVEWIPILNDQNLGLLQKEGMLSNFAFALIPLNFALVPWHSSSCENDRRKIFDWEKEITEHIASVFFPNRLLLPHSSLYPTAIDSEGFFMDMLLFAWGLTKEEWESSIERFRERLLKTSGQLTQLGTDVLPSEFYPLFSHDMLLAANKNSEESIPHTLQSIEEKYYRSKAVQSEAVHKALLYIMANIEKKITLQDVADFACISAGYLSTMFKREYKQNMVDFINNLKIERACELLRENRHYISEISNMLGFEDAFYFSRVFRKYTGLSPSQFRARSNL